MQLVVPGIEPVAVESDCAAGFFGQSCEKKCSSRCTGDWSCEQATGNCSQCGKPDWAGPTCELCEWGGDFPYCKYRKVAKKIHLDFFTETSKGRGVGIIYKAILKRHLKKTI